MLLPSIFGENLFDDWFDFPDFRDMDHVEKKLYGKHADRLMKTDVHEHEDHYEVDIDLPGFKKEEITIELQKGMLTVAAAKGLSQDEKGKKGKVIRKERYGRGHQGLLRTRRTAPERSETGKGKTARKEDHHDRRLIPYGRKIQPA